MAGKKKKALKGEMEEKQKKTWITEEAIQRRRHRLRDRRDVVMLFRRIVYIIVFLTIFFFLFFGIHTVNGEDMEPRLSDGDLLLYFRLDPDYLAREVVVYEAGGRARVGRIIARPGDEVEIASNEVKINGYITAEEDIYHDTPDYDGRVSYPLVLGDDEYFILADYREGARDSRVYGAIPKDAVKGKVITAIRSSGF